MSDGVVQATLSETPEFDNMYARIERERSSLENIAASENQVHARMCYLKENGRSHDNAVQAELNSLAEHDTVPRILAKDDFRDGQDFGESAQFRHREKQNSSGSMLPFTLYTSRPVNRNEYVGNKDAMDAYWKEWSNLETKGVWRWDSLAEWDDVSAKAKAKGDEIHFGYLFGFMVIKGDEFPEGDPRRRWKYRIVFQGNEVKDQDWQVALFQQLATAPATLEAARVAEVYSCFPGHSVEVQDVEQAYISADLGGTPYNYPRSYGRRPCTRCGVRS